MTTPLVEAKNLHVYFPFSTGVGLWKKHFTVRAVNNIDLQIHPGETLGLVGESGCGKTTLGRTLLSLIPHTNGHIRFGEHDLSKISKKDLNKLRKHMQIIFQNPYASLNPRMTIGNFIKEPIKQFFNLSNDEIKEKIRFLLESVGLDPRFANRYPHEFSGGQRQRIMIARALATEPQFIVADEPVSALDVSIQAQILNLLKELKNKFNLTLLFISHDLTTVKYICDRIAVMYLGKIVEIADTKTLFNQPQHPYTKMLISAIPIPDPKVERQREHVVLEGEVPSPIVEETKDKKNGISGCVFYSRCPMRIDRCKQESPMLKGKQDNHIFACHLQDE